MLRNLGNILAQRQASEHSEPLNTAQLARSTQVTPAFLRSNGDAARDRNNWVAACYYYAKLLECETDDYALWLQYGHVLKEHGLLAEARRAYEKALELRPNDPEAPIQMAFLSKMQCDFEGALRLYQQSASLGYHPASFIEQEIAFLRRSTGKQARRSIGEGRRPVIYLSSAAVPVSEVDPVSLKRTLGGTHYSYIFIMRGIKNALEKAGYLCKYINNPAFIPKSQVESNACTSIHIGFYPPDVPRYLKGAYNIVCLAWEFERLPTRVETRSYHAFADYVAMLSRAQRVWAISDYTAAALRRSGVPNVACVPSPVSAEISKGRQRRPDAEDVQQLAVKLERIIWTPLAIWPQMQAALSAQALSRQKSLLDALLQGDDGNPPILFISIFNVHDYRKQMKPAVEAFIRFAQTHKNCYLLLKASCIDSEKADINRLFLMDQVAAPNEMIAPLVSDRILLTTDALSREEMNWLFESASHYICSSHAEGQNLPLIEAMSRGVVPVSVDHTAMRDYISEENSVVIRSQSLPMTIRLAERYGLNGLSTNFVDAKDVLSALEAARALTDAQYAQLSAVALNTVTQKFSDEALLEEVGRVVESLRTRVAELAEV